MRAVVQRVSMATVRVDGREVGRCGRGLLLLVGVHRDDTADDAAGLAAKVANLRVFADGAGRTNLSILDVPLGERDPVGGQPTAWEYEVLAVSNFTVLGDARKSRRPSFTASAPFEIAEVRFEEFVGGLRTLGIDVQTGVFGANMEVALVNDGPMTLVVETGPREM